MADIGEMIADLLKKIGEQGERTHAAFVLSSTSVLEAALQSAIQTKFRPLDKTMTERLFEGYGPISSFAAKIDLAYALDITTTEVHTDLNKIRRIRNEFAHSPDMLTLGSQRVKQLLNLLRKPETKKTDMLEIFFECVMANYKFLEAYLTRMGVE